jgi:subtilisin family serine protease
MYGTVTRAGLAALRAERGVQAVIAAPQLSLIRPDAKADAKLTTELTWGIRQLKIDKLWDKGHQGKGVLIGHLDTGVDGNHASLKGAIKHFAEFDDFGQQIQPSPKPFDTEDHGTHTAATICGRSVGKRSVGVAPQAQLASAIVIEGGDVIARVLGGMDWVIGKGARILSMSLGLRGWWEDFVAITGLLRTRGVLPVFAIGNEGPGTSRSPGNYSNVLSIGAHDRSGVVASFSSSQRFRRKADAIVPDLVAPGVGIISARPGGGWQSMDGSSMATPHVAGLAALLMGAQKKRTIDEVESAILQSCSLAVGMARQRAGRGVPDGLLALKILEAMP